MNKKKFKTKNGQKPKSFNPPKAVESSNGHTNGLPASNSEPSVETLFARKLASNDPKIREKALKKLSLWLKSRTQANLIKEDELMLLWKGLYYCFWMSDKPLVQEAQAENVSQLLGVLSSHPETSLIFVKCFLQTISREWFSIDRFRMDKFMMFVRRFLRQIFRFLKEHQFKGEVCERFLGLLFDDESNGIFSRSFPRNSLGFQLHFIDIFLEELAKVGGEKLGDETIRLFLKPYARLVKTTNEQRIESQVEDRIFLHLMRQSDIGIAYDDFLENGASDDDEDEEDESSDKENDQENGDKEDEEMEEGDSEVEENEMLEDGDNEAADPRAGGVNAVIPQLTKLDFKKLADDIFEIANEIPEQKVDGGKKQKNKNSFKVIENKRKRSLLFKLVKQFRQLAEGKYPLMAEDPDEEVNEVPDIPIDKVLGRLGKEAQKEMDRAKKDREEYRLALKMRKKGLNGGVEVVDGKTEDSDDDGAEDLDGEVDQLLQGQNFDEVSFNEDEEDESEEEEEEEVTKEPSAKKAKLDKKAKKKKKKKGQSDDQKSPEKKVEQKSPKQKTPEKKADRSPSPDKKLKQKTPEKKVDRSPSPDKKLKQKTPEKKADRSPSPEKKLKEKVQEKSPKAEVSIESSPSPKKNKKKAKKRKHDECVALENVEKTESPKKKADGEEPSEEQLNSEKSPNNKKANKKGKKRKFEEEEKLPQTGISPEFEPPKIKAKSENNLPKPVFAKVRKSPKNPAKKDEGQKSEESSTAKKKKKINIALTKNKFQSIAENFQSIEQSPDIPFDSDKIPKKSLLKNKSDISIVATPSPLSSAKKEAAKNAKLNSKSKAAKMLARMSASDFF